MSERTLSEFFIYLYLSDSMYTVKPHFLPPPPTYLTLFSLYLTEKTKKKCK